MKNIAIVCVAALVLAACGKKEQEGVPVAEVAVEEAPEVDVLAGLDMAELEVAAFNAAWGKSAPVTFDPRSENASVQTYRKGKLVQLGSDLYALVSDGQGKDDRYNHGSLSIHYLQRTPQGFVVKGSWPAFHTGGGEGRPAEWSVVSDLTPAPAILASDGIAVMNYWCTAGTLIEFTPEKPVKRFERLRLKSSEHSFDHESEEDVMINKGYSPRPGQVGRTIRLESEYGDDPAVLTLRGQTYVPAGNASEYTC